MRDSTERDLAVAEALGSMADARIKELEQTCADLRQVVRMCLQQFEFTYGKRSRGWDAQYLMARCGAVLGTTAGYRCPVCASSATRFEDGEIQCDNRNCDERPSTRYGRYTEQQFTLAVANQQSADLNHGD
jgi:hypothetical protein